MKITIITPVLNSKIFIEKNIQSVLNQNYTNFEHIIIDGGSTDGTLDVLKKYPHIKWISEPDKGQSHALNKGFKMATGDIIGWLNADEYYINNSFEKVVDFFQNKDVDVVYGNTILVDENNNFLRTKREIWFDFNILLYYGCYISTASTFFRKKIFDEGNFLDISYHYTMDYEFFIRLAKLGYRFKHLNKDLSVFTLSDFNKSSDIIKRTKDRHRVQKKYAHRNQKINNFLGHIYHIKHAVIKMLLLRIDKKG